MKTSIEIIDDITIELMQLNRAQAITDESNKSYFQGMIDALTKKRDDLLKDCAQHHNAIAAVIAKM